MLAYSIDGTPLVNPTRWIERADEAFGVAPERGSDLLIPGLAGEIPQPRVQDVEYDDLQVRVSGMVDASGAPSSDDSAQFLTNLRALQSLLRPSVGATLAVTKTLTTATGPIVLTGTARCVTDLAPRMEAPWTGLVLVRLKVYGGWT